MDFHRVHWHNGFWSNFHNRRVSNGDQVSRLAGLATKSKPSVDFSEYWQRHGKASPSR
jgi:hypothetical protein